MKISQTLGLIGAGNMGTAILEGLLAKKLMTPGRVWVYDKLKEKAHEFAKAGRVHQARSNLELVQKSEIVLLAVKPQDLIETAREFKSALTKSHTLISILAGTPVRKIRDAVGEKPAVVRAMPNLGAKAGASMTAVTGDRPSALKLAEKIFSGCGKTMILEEKYFDLVTAVSGSGPAYFFYLTELLAEAAVRLGLSAEKADQLAVQTMLGAGLLASSSSQTPAGLRRMVTSKGGTTEAALKVFADKKLNEIMDQAVQAAEARGRELSRA